jgi:hypothetical protein
VSHAVKTLTRSRVGRAVALLTVVLVACVKPAQTSKTGASGEPERFHENHAGECRAMPPVPPADGGPAPCVCGDEATCIAKCQAGSGSDCDALAGCYAVGMGVPRNAEKHVRYAQRGCELADPSACRALGEAYRSGFGLDRNVSRAKELFARALDGFRERCDVRDAASCYMLGHAYARGEGVAPDESTARAFYVRACELGDDFTCVSLAANASREGDARARIVSRMDSKRELEWLTLACERSCSLGCQGVGDAARRGTKSAVRLTQEWRRRCAEGDASACRKSRAAMPTQASETPGQR